MASSGTRSTHEAHRRCVGCYGIFPRAELFRVVRKPDGSVCPDPGGRSAGRGAYVCSGECLERALAKRAFDRALRTRLDEAVYDTLSAAFALGRTGR